MELAQTFSSKVTTKTSSEDRQTMSCDLVKNINHETDKGVNFEADIVTELVRVLLRANLDSVYTTFKLREWLLSQDVRNVITRLNTSPENASAILRGMSESARAGVGFANFITWSAELLHAWFVKNDNTVSPTLPGFVLELFTYINTCANRQVDVCGIRNAATNVLDRKLLPLVSRALSTETRDTLNKGDYDGHTSLHYSASIMRLPQVTKALLVHPDLNINVFDYRGKSPLLRTIYEIDLSDTEAFLTSEAILSDDRLDLTVEDPHGSTVVDQLCVLLINAKTNTRGVLKLIQRAVNRSSVTPDMLQLIVTTLLKPEVQPAIRGLHEQVIIEAASHTSFDINQELNESGQTLGHLAALSGKVSLLLKVIAMVDFNPDSQDDSGNTIIYYACANLPNMSAKKVIEYPSVTWNFTHTNCAGQTAWDYYQCLPDGKRHPQVLDVLEKRSGHVMIVTQVPSDVPVPRSDHKTFQREDRRAFLENRGNQNTSLYEDRPASNLVPVKTVDRPARELQWNSPISKPAVAKSIQVQPSTQGFVNTKLGEICNNKVFRMTSARKGKACIICVSNFLVQTLSNLDSDDSKVLVELWSQMGYEVLVPSSGVEGQLTAEEIQKALREFAQLLTEEDPSAVVCLLSHGHQGYIYGSDGKTVFLVDLLKCLDNERCPQMKKKPKLAIIQACAESSTDHGVPASTSSGTSLAYTAANESALPTMSDLVICSPTQRAYESYVKSPKNSVFIKHLVKTFAKHAKEENIHSLMTMVNQAVYEEEISDEDEFHPCKQISRVESCLTKLLYLFPCPMGKNGQDWQLLNKM